MPAVSLVTKFGLGQGSGSCVLYYYQIYSKVQVSDDCSQSGCDFVISLTIPACSASQAVTKLRLRGYKFEIEKIIQIDCPVMTRDINSSNCSNPACFHPVHLGFSEGFSDGFN